MSKTIKIISRISSVEKIAEGHCIRELAQLREQNNWGQSKVIFTMALGLARLLFGFHWNDVMSSE